MSQHCPRQGFRLTALAACQATPTYSTSPLTRRGSPGPVTCYTQVLPQQWGLKCMRDDLLSKAGSGLG